jgi:predicted dehydrogenase
VVLAEANFSLTSPVRPGSWKAGGRGTPLVQLGVHHADTLAYLLGPVSRTRGASGRVHSGLVDDVAVATLELASGALATIASSYVSPPTYSLRLLGTEAVLELRADLGVWPAAHRLDGVTSLSVAGRPVAFDERDPLVEELTEFARCLGGGGRPETGADEALAALRVVEEAIA